ncbi:uncharacterized protein LOC106066310 isoform X2 [Biomphalaria glabrata]|uniref:Uncharacterized protein LOC106066310 isoform X2 n=1 Tax=Biomphalaria glabrata TaxID=6526 RepID=A0A9W3AJA8_BIOGL|nr:uncharacterized protein LOC106066310 isoform X2 [Biomphalaria glabrata]
MLTVMVVHTKKELCVCALYVLCIHMIKSQDGWFGPNKEFKCHCESSCSSDGSCLGNGKCARGWFGLKCQYQDLTILENTVTTPNVSMLTDRDDRTCMNISGQTIVITFNRTYVFTWLRATLNDSASLPGLRIQFSKTTSMTSKLECQNQKYFLVDNATLDIQCDLTEAIRTIIITGTGRTSLCSLYINGGRNVALKQRTWQTSDYWESYPGTFDSSKAVDGNTSSNFYGVLSCSHTNDFDPRPMWSVTFPLSEITRYVIYNRDDHVINRLVKFVLSGEDSAIQKFSYIDASDTGIPVYIVTDPAKNKLILVKINATQYVTLCEVEIYGDCIAGTYTTSGLQCANCPAICPNSCHRDSGSCSICFGYSNPPACTLECKAGKWGRNCVRECSYVCKDQSCDRVTGLCEHICDSLTDLSCPDDCPKGYHGSNCTLECSSTCKDLSCNRLGYCIACVSGYTGRYCEKVKLGLASETSGLTFSSGVGIGVAVGALVIILIVVVIVIICRTRLKTLRAKSNDDLKHDTQLQNYDSVKQIHEYNHPYESSRFTFEEKVPSGKKDDREGKLTIHYENTSNTVYETTG